MPGAASKLAASAAGRRWPGARSLVTSCRAVVLPRFGGPEVLELREGVGVPDLKPTEVLVRTRAVSINPLDLRVRDFSLIPGSCCNFFGFSRCLVAKMVEFLHSVRLVH